MATKNKIMPILDNATKSEYYPQSSWSQSQQMQLSPSSYYPGYSTRSGVSEMPHTLHARCRICQITLMLNYKYIINIMSQIVVLRDL